MNEIRITSELNKDIMNQLKGLLREFIQETNLANDAQGVELTVYNKRKNIFSKFLEKYKKDRKVKESIKTAQDIYKGKMEGSKMYCALNGNEVIGFEMAQVQNDTKNNKVVGWKPWLYMDPKYRLKSAKIENYDGKEKNITRALDCEVEKWFSESGVTHQKTGTGINMTKNIVTYIREGFLPYDKNSKNVFMEKTVGQEIDTKYKRELIREILKGNIEIPSKDEYGKNDKFKDDLKDKVIEDKKLDDIDKSKEISEKIIGDENKLECDNFSKEI